MYQRIFSSRFFVFVLFATFLLAACQPQTPPATEEPVVSPLPATETPLPTEEPSDPNMLQSHILLDPALAVDADSVRVNQHLYTGLVVLDANGEPQPGIAESWTISDDQLTYIFTLRSDAAFSDGSPITPDDVADNVNRWLDPQSPLRGTGNYETWQQVFAGFLGEEDADGRPVSPVDGVQKVDFNTVIIHLNRPVPELLTLLADPAFAVLKPDSLSEGNYGMINSSIISSGPYIVSSWTADSLTLTPNPAYWGEVPQGDLQFTFR
jgi:ABC-type transport system substrate-binding protein